MTSVSGMTIDVKVGLAGKNQGELEDCCGLLFKYVKTCYFVFAVEYDCNCVRVCYFCLCCV